MPVAAFPLAKLGMLAMRQISKPIAQGLSRRAKNSYFFREWVCIPVAQLFHLYDVRVRMRIMGLARSKDVAKLDQNAAIETGAQILSEVIILGIASAALIYEYRRQSEKEAAKEAIQDEERTALRLQLMELEMSLDRQAAQTREMTRLIYDLQDQINASTWSRIFGSKDNSKDEKAVVTEIEVIKQ